MPQPNLPPMTPVSLDVGAFVISFDFELAWGTRGRPSAKSVGPYLEGTRRAIDGLLELFERYEISATWVVVGGMFLGGSRRHPWLDNEEFADIPVGDERSHPHWYARDVLEKIVACRVPQEIGCHTLTHMFVNESEESRQRFDWELGCCVELFKELGLPRPRSFIYPKHYMAHFDLLTKHGIECFRGPEMGWWERMPTPTTRGIARLISQRLRGRPYVGSPEVGNDRLAMIPSSHYYPGTSSVGRFVSVADRISRANKGLDAAARQLGVYHLWTHPFNLGLSTAVLLEGLETVLKHSQKLTGRNRLENLSMGNLSEKC